MNGFRLKIKRFWLLGFIFLFVSFGCATSGEKGSMSSTAEIEAMLPTVTWDKSKGWKEGIKLLSLANASQDAKKNFRVIGVHFLGVGGYSSTFPGLDLKKDKVTLDGIFSGAIKSTIVKETSDVVSGAGHRAYVGAAQKYVEVYNREILKLAGLND